MSLNQSKILEGLSDYLGKRFLADGVEIKSSDEFEDIGIDSMTVVELVMYLEEEFGIVIPADQLTPNNLATLESLVSCAVQNQND